mgnify:CR=1 FL=1
MNSDNVQGCPKCGRIISRGLAACPYCKYNFKTINEYYQKIEAEKKEIKNFTEVVSLKYDLENEKYVRAYVGPQYEKLSNGKFSFFSFLFGPSYWVYRGMKKKAYSFAFFVISVETLSILLAGAIIFFMPFFL